MDKRKLQRAIGVSHCKTLNIANECASVEIIQETDHRDTPEGVEYTLFYVHGDCDVNKHFARLDLALSYAIAELAKYMDCSPNR